MSFLSTLKTIGEDVEKGLAKVAPVLQAAGNFVPGLGPILIEIGTAITNLENGGHAIDATTLSEIFQAAAVLTAAKTAPAATVTGASA